MKFLRAFLTLPFLLAACGGGDSESGVPVVDTSAAGAMPAGSVEGEASYSGIPFATGAETPFDFEGYSIPVKMVHWHRDYSTRMVTMQVVEETVTLSPGFYSSSFGDATVTLNGKTYPLTGYATEFDGKYFYHSGRIYGSDTSVANRHDLYVSVNGGVDQFWDWATFVIGAETDPAWVAAQSGSAAYDGWFHVQGFPSYDGATASDQYRNLGGQIHFTVDFDANTVTGDFEAFTSVLNETGGYEDNVFGRVAETPMLGNGFDAALIFDSCTGYTACDAGDSRISGALYGAGGKQLTGVIFLDAEFTRSGTDARLTGPGYFYADPATE